MSDRLGWVCPVCGTANAPHLAQCPCSGTATTVDAAPQTTATTAASAATPAATTAATELAGISSKAVASSRKRYQYNDSDFNTFWEIYPLRKGKASAFARWCGAVAAGIPPQQIIDGALRYRNDPNRDDAFTKWPEGWLSGGRWDDDPEPPRPTSLRHQDRAAEIARDAKRDDDEGGAGVGARR